MVVREISGKVYVDGVEVGTVSGTYIDEVAAGGGTSPSDLTIFFGMLTQWLPTIMIILMIVLIVSLIAAVFK